MNSGMTIALKSIGLWNSSSEWTRWFIIPRIVPLSFPSWLGISLGFNFSG